MPTLERDAHWPERGLVLFAVICPGPERRGSSARTCGKGKGSFIIIHVIHGMGWEEWRDLFLTFLLHLTLLLHYCIILWILFGLVWPGLVWWFVLGELGDQSINPLPMH